MASLQERAEAAEEAEDLQSALELWRELARREGESYSLLRYGSLAKRMEKWDEAESAFSEALRQDPGSSLILECIGDLWARRTDKDEDESFGVAKQWFLRALEYERNARLLTRLGATFQALGDGAAARDAFEQAIELNPRYEEALYNLAQVEEETDPQKAAELLERAIEIDPDYALAHQKLGVLYEEVKDLTRAEYHFRRSLEIDPVDYWSGLYLANNLGVQGRNEEAERMYRFATSLRSDYVEGFEFFARFLESVGKNREAGAVRARAAQISEDQIANGD
jgi:tetratricopeptide (TPR) repeat protein